MLLIAVIAATPVLAQARTDEAQLLIIEFVVGERGPPREYVIPLTDDSMTNPHYKLLPFHWYTTVGYRINPSNPSYGLDTTAVQAAITTSANTWDTETAATVFSYQGTTSRQAGLRDNSNVVAWGPYRGNVIAVTYIWYIGQAIVETDTRLNKAFRWSSSGEAGKMDLQNIVTHELGHWAGLADLYSDVDYWLTMYGYANYAENYKQTLGLGDILGLEAVYGA